MPLYQYECECGNKPEILKSFSDIFREEICDALIPYNDLQDLARPCGKVMKRVIGATTHKWTNKRWTGQE